MIKKIKVSNYIHFNDIEIDFEVKSKIIPNRLGLDTIIELGDYKILKQIGVIGANSSGKTTTIQVMTLITNILNVNRGANFFYNNLVQICMDIENKLMQKELRQNKLTNENNIPFRNFQDFFKKDFLKKSEYLKDIVALWRNEIFAQISYNYNKNILVEIEVIDNHGLKTKIKAEVMHDYPKVKIMINNENFFINYSDDILGNENYFNEYQNIIKEKGFPLMGISDNYSNFFNSIKYENKLLLDKEWKEDFLKWIKLADPSIKEFISKDNGKHYIIENFLTLSNETKSIKHLSHGTLIWLNWFFQLKHNNFILFDEIDSSLHIKLIRHLLKVASDKNIQVIFTTHNPLVFGKTFRNDAIYFLDYNDQKLKRLIDFKKFDKDKNIQKMILEEEIGVHPDLSIFYEDLI